MLDRKYGRASFTTPNNIGEDEPVFIIRAKDSISVPALRSYANLYAGTVALQKSEGDEYRSQLDFAQSIENAIEDFEDWQSKNETKIPD